MRFRLPWMGDDFGCSCRQVSNDGDRLIIPHTLHHTQTTRVPGQCQGDGPDQDRAAPGDGRPGLVTAAGLHGPEGRGRQLGGQDGGCVCVLCVPCWFVRVAIQPSIRPFTHPPPKSLSQTYVIYQCMRLNPLQNTNQPTANRHATGWALGGENGGENTAARAAGGRAALGPWIKE